MARARSPARDKAYEIYKEHEGTITNRAISEMLDVDEKKIAVWKSRDKWNVVQQTKNNVVQQKKAKSKQLKKALVESDELTDKQRIFCIYYIMCFNATKAYQKAYECDYISAKSNGHRLLTKDYIISEIDRLKTDQATGLKLDARDVLQKYIDIAFSDITDFVVFGSKTHVAKDELGRAITDNDGNDITYNVNSVDFKNSPEVDGTIITEVKHGKDGVSVKLADKMKALEMLTKYTDMLDEKQLKQLKVEKARVEIDKLQNGDGSTTQESEIASMLRRMAGEAQ